MNMCPLFAFKLVIQLIPVPLPSCCMAASQVKIVLHTRQQVCTYLHKRSLSEQMYTYICTKGHRYSKVRYTSSEVMIYVVLIIVLVQTRVSCGTADSKILVI